MFNTFPYTAFAQNVGLVSMTGVKSRYVATFAGGVLVVLGLVPKLGGVVEGIPLPVLGGAGVALFGMVAASGVRTLAKVRFNNTNILVVAVAVGIGLLPTVARTIFDQFPTWFQIIFHSGISAGAIAAILLNLLLNSERLQARLADDPEIAPHDAVRGPAADPSTRGADTTATRAARATGPEPTPAGIGRGGGLSPPAGAAARWPAARAGGRPAAPPPPCPITSTCSVARVTAV